MSYLSKCGQRGGLVFEQNLLNSPYFIGRIRKGWIKKSKRELFWNLSLICTWNQQDSGCVLPFNLSFFPKLFIMPSPCQISILNDYQQQAYETFFCRVQWYLKCSPSLGRFCVRSLSSSSVRFMPMFPKTVPTLLESIFPPYENRDI